MLHHIEIYVSNLNASRTFWSTILSFLGYEVSDQWEDGFTLKNGKDAYLTFVQVSEKYATNTFHRCNTGLNHLAFEVKGRETVDNPGCYVVVIGQHRCFVKCSYLRVENQSSARFSQLRETLSRFARSSIQLPSRRSTPCVSRDAAQPGSIQLRVLSPGKNQAL